MLPATGRIALDLHSRQTAWVAYFLRRARWHRSELGLIWPGPRPRAAKGDAWIWEEVMPTLVGFGAFAPYLRSRPAKKSAAAFFPATKGWSYGGASGRASMSSRTVTQMSRSYGCSRKIRRTSLYARSFVSPFSAFPRATFLVSAFLNVRICANHSALTSRWRDGTGAEGAAWAWDGHPLGGMAKAPCLSIRAHSFGFESGIPSAV